MSVEKKKKKKQKRIRYQKQGKMQFGKISPTKTDESAVPIDPKRDDEFTIPKIKKTPSEI